MILSQAIKRPSTFNKGFGGLAITLKLWRNKKVPKDQSWENNVYMIKMGKPVGHVDGQHSSRNMP